MKWLLENTEETTAPIPGRPQFVERRVTKHYRGALTLSQIVEFACPCGVGRIRLEYDDGVEATCPECGREYRLELGVRRIDRAEIPPPGL